MRTEYGSFVAEPGPWAVVNAQPNREHVAVGHLERQLFTAYCPMVMKRVSHARVVKDLRRPLFPGYLFVRINPRLDRWRPILSTIGVRSLVRNGDEPGLIADAFVASLKSRERDGIVARPDTYKIGDNVSLIGGAFDGIVASIVGMDEKDRLTVLMDLLNRKVKVTVEARAVTAA